MITIELPAGGVGYSEIAQTDVLLPEGPRSSEEGSLDSSDPLLHQARGHLRLTPISRPGHTFLTTQPTFALHRCWLSLRIQQVS